MPTIRMMDLLLSPGSAPDSPARSRNVTPRRRLTFLVMLLALATTMIGFNPGTSAAASGPASFTITGKGWGHGVGMSQWGARGRAANKGETFRQILAHYYQGSSVVAGSISNEVRVLTASDAATVTLKVTTATPIGTTTAPAGSTITITRSGTALSVSGAVTTQLAAPLAIPLSPTANRVTVTVPGRSATTYEYGTLRVDTGSASGMRVIVRSLTMQQYLYGLGEMPMSWPVEALKSQIVAARTFAQKQINVRRGKAAYADFDLNAAMDGAYTGTTHTGTSYFTSNWKPAVDATNALVITHGGGLIDATFSASSGGYTANSETVWVASLPYLRSVSDPDDLTGGNPNANWSVTLTAAELGSWFGVGTMTSMTVTGVIPASKHLDKTDIRLVGTTGSKTVKGAAFRSTINARAGAARTLKSTLFSIAGSTPAPGTTTTAPPAVRLPTGSVTTAKANGRTIIIEGTAKDPDGPIFVRVVSTMGREKATRDYVANGTFRSSWVGAPGTRNVCVTLFDNPTLKAVSLGCRNVVVK